MYKQVVLLLKNRYFSKTEWPKNNITYYVIGGGIRTAV